MTISQSGVNVRSCLIVSKSGEGHPPSLPHSVFYPWSTVLLSWVCLSVCNVGGQWLRTVWQCESKNHPTCGFLMQTVENFKSVFTHLLYVPIYARLQIFIQLYQILTKLCHIKRDYLVHIICSKCPPSAETHAFRRLQKSLIALLIVVCGKSSQICCFYNVNKHWRHLLSKQT